MADASHQLRTPVSIVRTATQVTLARDSRTADEYREALTIIGEQSGRLSRLVDDMFLLSRAEAHGVPLRREFLHFDEVVADSARAVRVLADQRGVAVTIDGAEEVGLAGDDALLRQMVGNLLDNAIRHARADGTVRLQLERVRRPRACSASRTTVRASRLPIANGSSIASCGAANRMAPGWACQSPDGSRRRMAARCSWRSSRPGCTTFVVTLPIESRRRCMSGVQAEDRGSAFRLHEPSG